MEKLFIIKNENNVEFIVNEQELFEIANNWIDEWNENESEYEDNNLLYHDVDNWSDLLEVVEEYMSCQIEEFENKNTREMYEELSITR